MIAPLLGAVAILASVLVARSPVFALRDLEISGNAGISRGRIEALSGIEPGVNLHAVSTRGIERALLRDPRIKDAEVRRDLPDTLWIHVRVRRVVGTLRVAGRARVGIAEDGVSLGRIASKGPRMPDLGSVRDLPRPGERVTIDRRILTVAGSLGRRLRALVRSVAARGREVTMELRGGGVVRYGAVESIEQKNAAVLSLIRYARREELRIEIIDVRSPLSPVLRPVATPEQPAAEPPSEDPGA